MKSSRACLFFVASNADFSSYTHPERPARKIAARPRISFSFFIFAGEKRNASSFEWVASWYKISIRCRVQHFEGGEERVLILLYIFYYNKHVE